MKSKKSNGIGKDGKKEKKGARRTKKNSDVLVQVFIEK